MKKNLPNVGQKVRFISNAWFDGGEVAVGETGVITKAEIEEGQTLPTIHILLDEKYELLENNIYSFYPQCGEDSLKEFWDNCEILP